MKKYMSHISTKSVLFRANVSYPMVCPSVSYSRIYRIYRIQLSLLGIVTPFTFTFNLVFLY